MAGVVRSMAVVLAVTLAAMVPAWAQDANDDLKKEVETLKKKVAALEAETPAKPAPQAVSSDKPEENATLADELNKWLKTVNLTGFVDAGYIYNPHNPQPTIGPGNPFRSFDSNPHTFQVNNAQLMLEKVPDAKSIAGFRIKTSFGSDATVLSATDPASGFTSFNLTEAYVDVLAPVGKGIDIKLGKFVTNAGYEVIESKDDFNYTRSLLFTLAIPFTHTGIRATYQLLDPQLLVGIGVNNGWDDMQDTNYSKNFEFITSIKPTESLSFGGTFLFGQDERDSASTPIAGQSGDKRYLIDLVATFTAGDLTLGANFDYAHDQNAVVGTFNSENATWVGYAAYIKYQVSKLWAPSVRAEAFRDSDGFRTGTQQSLSEFTLTSEFDVTDNLIVRLEYRHDHSSEKVFLRHSTPKYNDDEFAFEAIVKF